VWDGIPHTVIYKCATPSLFLQYDWNTSAQGGETLTQASQGCFGCVDAFALGADVAGVGRDAIFQASDDTLLLIVELFGQCGE
jgi:hypothetical protein